MNNNLPVCYEKEYCYFCKKLNCQKRTKKSGYSEIFTKMCDGNCYECNEAVRSSLYHNFYALENVNEKISSCLMYQYFTEFQEFEFCGRIGIISEYSKIEYAILQLKKCNDCEVIKKYHKLLNEISLKLKEIPVCFESMTELTSTNILSKANSCILEVLESDFECKTKIVLKRLVKEYLDFNKDKEINLEKLCEYIKETHLNIDYYIHPMTLKELLYKVENE